MRMASSKQGEFKLKEIFIFWSKWLPCHDDDDLMEELGEKIAQKVALKTAEPFKAEGGEGDKIALKAAQKTVYYKLNWPNRLL